MAFVNTRCPKKKLIWNSNQFSDLNVRDFETSYRVARNFKVIKTTVSQLRSENKNLKQKCKPLKKNIETSNNLLEIVKKKSFMTDFAADNLKVHNTHHFNFNCLLINCLISMVCKDIIIIKKEKVSLIYLCINFLIRQYTFEKNCF